MNDERVRVVVAAVLGTVTVIVPGLHDVLDPEAVAGAVAALTAAYHGVIHWWMNRR